MCSWLVNWEYPIWRSTSSLAEETSVGRAENQIPIKETLLSRGADPPKNASVLICATLLFSVPRLRDVRTGNGFCINPRHFSSLDWVRSQRVIMTMRSRSSSTPMVSSSSTSSLKVAWMAIGKSGQISSAAFTSVLELHTSRKLKDGRGARRQYFAIFYMCVPTHATATNLNRFSYQISVDMSQIYIGGHRRKACQLLNCLNCNCQQLWQTPHKRRTLTSIFT